MHATEASKVEPVRPKAIRLEYSAVGWNVIEAVVALVAGALASRIALPRFGPDSVIEAASGFALL